MLSRISESGKLTEYYVAKTGEMLATYVTQIPYEDFSVLGKQINRGLNSRFLNFSKCVSSCDSHKLYISFYICPLGYKTLPLDGH